MTRTKFCKKSSLICSLLRKDRPGHDTTQSSAASTCAALGGDRTFGSPPRAADILQAFGAHSLYILLGVIWVLVVAFFGAWLATRPTLARVREALGGSA